MMEVTTERAGDPGTWRRKYRLRNLVLALIGAYVVLGVASRCQSAALPPEPGPAELALVNATHFRATVGVKRDRFPVYSEQLIGALRGTGLFDRVEREEDLPGATLLASVDRHIYGTATIPCVAFVSLGFVPTIVDEEWGEAFTLRRNVTGNRAVSIDFSYTGPTTLGLWAGVQNISSRFAAGNPRETDRFNRAFAAAICSRAEEVTNLFR